MKKSLKNVACLQFFLSLAILGAVAAGDWRSLTVQYCKLEQSSGIELFEIHFIIYN